MKLEAYVKKRKITLTQIANDTGISLSLLSRIASKKRRPSPQKAVLIERATRGEVSRMELLYP